MNAARSIFGIIASAVCFAPPALLAQENGDQDPVFGAWLLNLDKSTFDPGPPPLRQRRLYEPHPDGIEATVVTVNAQGVRTTTEYVAEYDGVEYTFRGASNVDTIILSRIDRTTAVATFKHGRSVAGEARRTISADGSTMTVAFRIGDQTDNRAVYERVELTWLEANPVYRRLGINAGIMLVLVAVLVVAGLGYRAALR